MGENFGVEKRWKNKIKSGQGGWDFRSSEKRPQRAHPELVHWWLLIHSSRTGLPACARAPYFRCPHPGALQ